jgi:hypothetical protein
MMNRITTRVSTTGEQHDIADFQRIYPVLRDGVRSTTSRPVLGNPD